MGRKIFVSYKHADNEVAALGWNTWTTAADYLTQVQTLLGEENIYKGEQPDEDISNMSDDTIAEHLKKKIRDSSVTIILVSKNMKEFWKAEKDQWIPWEISYSLKEIQRDGVVSKTNAMLSVILPDKMGRYEYMKYRMGYNCGHTTWSYEHVFEIIWKNMFNKKEPDERQCIYCNKKVRYEKDPHYIANVKWCDFRNDPQRYIDVAISIHERKNDYHIRKII